MMIAVLWMERKCVEVVGVITELISYSCCAADCLALLGPTQLSVA